MERKLSLLGGLALLLPFFLWAHTIPGPSFRDEIREVRGFHALTSAGSILVEVRFGDQESVRLVGNEAALREVETVVEQGTLKIRFKRNAGEARFNRDKVTAYVTAKQLKSLAQSGAGNITVVGTVAGDELNASVSGSGKLAFDSDIKVCNARISGSGRIVATGNAAASNISISGSGRFEGNELKSQSANLKLSGSGSIAIHVNKQLDASISGSGTIHYSGNAQTNVRTSGSGRLHKISASR
ncbi:head GIN domain-containing protein [Parapedobacter indicus]|uniref:Putative auto-transporter adhesin, head GIN domain n=1 Tax=Parapedobacter indicus TaxID=1477437 RepID=A0A1I3D178_9SPHI|nr:head GIN domain-containing protein [Parapedobacter indicus]PPL04485.1 putative autotransporter adhesin-like protein [Parapedobacter indicus]SFH80465.1 Putative auto-transporter adhesin, head GIN domain [Parapedobacter indicus]